MNHQQEKHEYTIRGAPESTQCIATAPFSLARPRCGRVERGVEHGHSADMDLMFSKDINKQLLKKAKCSFTWQWLLEPVMAPNVGPPPWRLVCRAVQIYCKLTSKYIQYIVTFRIYRYRSTISNTFTKDPIKSGISRITNTHANQSPGL